MLGLFIGGDESAESVLHGLVGIMVEINLPCVGVEAGTRVGSHAIEASNELLCRIAQAANALVISRIALERLARAYNVLAVHE